jgi:hypothetical protein
MKRLMTTVYRSFKHVIASIVGYIFRQDNISLVEGVVNYVF